MRERYILPFQWGKVAEYHALLSRTDWDLDIRVVNFLDFSNTEKSEWINEIEAWTSQLGFSFALTSNTDTRQKGCSCGPIAAWVAHQLHSAGPTHFKTLDLSLATSTEVSRQGYAYADLPENNQFVSETDVTRMCAAYAQDHSSHSQGVPAVEADARVRIYEKISTAYNNAIENDLETPLCVYISNTEETERPGFHYVTIAFLLAKKNSTRQDQRVSDVEVSDNDDVHDDDATTNTPAAVRHVPISFTNDKTPVFSLRRAETLLDDYANAGTGIFRAFPDMFHLPRGLDRHQPLSASTCERLLVRGDNRFSGCVALVYHLASVTQRHAVNRGVAVTVKANPAAFSAFASTITDVGFQSQLDVALKNPSGPVALTIAQSFMKLCRPSSSKAPWRKRNDQPKS